MPRIVYSSRVKAEILRKAVKVNVGKNLAN